MKEGLLAVTDQAGICQQIGQLVVGGGSAHKQGVLPSLGGEGWGEVMV